jgi:hypothetical protein
MSFNYSCVANFTFSRGSFSYLIQIFISHSDPIISPADIKVSGMDMSPDPEIAEPLVMIPLNINFVCITFTF